ncbi:MAG TPA: phosphoribosylamine--glycine ligase [Alphaproteobacteria bacterium]
MKVLVIGGGGREHALCWAISASALCDKLYCAPGNAGIARVAECVNLPVEDIDGLVKLAQDKAIDFVVVGPEVPLVLGLVDRLEAAGIAAFGPTAAAAALEGSKGFTKDMCAKYGIPTAAYGRFTAVEPALAFLKQQTLPIVVKADGLAAGKGVVIAETMADAEAAVREMLSGSFGEAGASLVIEEFLNGEEASFFALVDGKTALPFASAQDHKRVGDGDTGPNTGGMGAYSPAPVVTDALAARVMAEIIEPTVAAMADMGRPFKGVLFAGLMIDAGGPKLLEYNTRFGDPECQVLMTRLKSDLLPALMAARDGALSHVDLRWRDETALTVVMAANGYPGAYEKGSEIRNLDAAGKLPDVQVFHAGTAEKNGKIVATGGRVLAVTASGKSAAEAQKKAYAAVDAIDWPGGFCRRDIGWRAIKR